MVTQIVTNELDQAVRALMMETATSCVMPYWRNLRASDIKDKGGGDPVTQADFAAEQALHKGLSQLLPGAQFVGEEAVSEDPSLLNRLSGDAPVWVVDPVDGTKNFSDGNERFCLMVALVQNGECLGGWIYLPVEGRMVSAQKGAGATIDGTRLQAPSEGKPLGASRAAIHLRYMPPRVSSVVAPRLSLAQSNTEYYCAGLTYVEVARRNVEFAFFWRTNPWDHLAGSLIVSEAGGRVARLDGKAYDARDRSRFGLLATTPADAWDDYAKIVFGGVQSSDLVQERPGS